MPNYTEQQESLANLARVLASPARIAILETLGAAEGCICRDFAKQLNLSQPTVSKHLAELRAANLISGTVDGTSRSYCINAERWQHLREQLGAFLTGVCCANHSQS